MPIAEVLRNAASAGGTPAFAAPNADLTSEHVPLTDDPS